MRIIFNLALLSSLSHFHVVNGFTSVPNKEENASMMSGAIKTTPPRAFSNNSNIKTQPKMKLSTAKTSLQMSSEGKSDVKPMDVIELSDDKIAEMIEVTFIKACLQLATGYVDVLKLFLAATNAAYDRKIPLPKLIQSVDDCPLNTANRDLSPQEIEIRSTWMTVSYLTLETIDRLEGTRTGDEEYLSKLDALDISQDIRDTYGDIVKEMVRKDLGLEESSNNDGSGADALSSSDPQAAALIAYNKKIISLSISNVKEARLAYEKVIDEDEVGPPRPNIPGTY